MFKPGIDYDEFDMDNYYECGDSESSSGFDWNGWYVYLTGLLLIGLIVVLIRKIKANNKSTNSYHRILGKQQQTDYGTSGKKFGENAQISMQDTKI